MNRPWRNAILIALMTFLAGASASPAGGTPAPQQRGNRTPAVPGQMMPFRFDTVTAEAWDRTRVDYARTIVETQISAGALTRTDGRLAPAQKGAAVQIGMHRDLPAPWSERVRGTELSWTRVRGGHVASLSADSPGARATRLALRVTRMPAGAEIRFFEPGDPQVVWGPYDRAALQEPLGLERDRDKGNPAARRTGKSEGFRAYWSPVMRGDRVGVEIFLPEDADPGSLVLSLPRISHLERSPYDTRDLSDIGSSGSCQQDVACDPKWSTTNLAVAKEVFDADGGTYTCTGQLVANTAGDGEPLFATANHCMSAQSETVSAAFFWFFQRSACNGSAPSSVTQTTGGADLLSTSDVEAGFDFTLMRLRNSPPGGVSMAGWTASAVGSGDRIAGIHHPAGDLKKLSTGSVSGFDTWGRRSPSSSHIEVRWSEGVTEGGSSGSGLFLDGTWPNQPLVGVLTGGSSYCSSPTAPDLYGRLDRVYDDLEPWLDPRSITTISPGQTLSQDVPRNGWIYRRVTVSGALDVTLETTSGDADLYLQRGLAPARDLYDCRSQEGGTSDDSCSIGSTGGSTYVIGILGYEASGFRLSVAGSGGGDGGGDGSGDGGDGGSGDGGGDGSGDGGGDGSGDGGGDGGDPPTAPADPGSASAQLVGGGIELTWSDTSTNEEGFRIDRQIEGGAWSQLTTVGAGTTRLVDSDLSPSTTYCYAVQAYNGAGTSGWSNTTCATTAPADGGGDGGGGGGGDDGDPDPTTVPDRPTGLYLFRFRGEIDLVWDDNSRDEDGFHIYRRGGGQGWQRIATVPADDFYFFDETVARRTRYCYVVRAFNAAGESDNSNRRCIRSR